MSKNRVLADRGWKDPKDLPKGPNGRTLCRYCGNETLPPKRTFCSALCIHEHKIRSNPGYAREQVYKRDRGVCRECGTDTDELHRTMHQLYKEKGRDAYQALVDFYWGKFGFGFEVDRHAWEADHIVPVAHGGGTCGLDNYQTLCVACHKKKTAKQVRKR